MTCRNVAASSAVLARSFSAVAPVGFSANAVSSSLTSAAAFLTASVLAIGTHALSAGGSGASWCPSALASGFASSSAPQRARSWRTLDSNSSRVTQPLPSMSKTSNCFLSRAALQSAARPTACTSASKSSNLTAPGGGGCSCCTGETLAAVPAAGSWPTWERPRRFEELKRPIDQSISWCARWYYSISISGGKTTARSSSKDLPCLGPSQLARVASSQFDPLAAGLRAWRCPLREGPKRSGC